MSGKGNRSEIESSELVRCGILDGTIAVSSPLFQTKTASYQLRHALMTLLDDTVGTTPAELRSRRKERLARVEKLLSMRR